MAEIRFFNLVLILQEHFASDLIDKVHFLLQIALLNIISSYSLPFQEPLPTMSTRQAKQKVASRSFSSVDQSSADLRSPFSNLDTNLRDTIRMRRGAQSSVARALILLLSDMLLITLSWIWWIIGGSAAAPADSLSILPAIISSFPTLAIIIGIMMSRGLYKAGSQWQNFLASFKAVALGVAISGLVLLTYQPLQIADRLTVLQIAEFGLSSLVFILGSRAAFTFSLRLARQQGAIRHAVCLICDENERSQALQVLEGQRHYIVKHVASASALDLGNRSDILSTLKSMKIDEVFISWDAICRRLFLC